MKKLFAVFSLLIFLFSACAVKPLEQPSAAESFSAVLSVTGEDYAMQCEWDQAQPGNAIFRLTEPESLSGVTLTFTGKDCQTSLGELSTQVKLPLKSFFLELLEAIEQESELSVAQKGESIETEGKIKTGAFKIKQNTAGDYQSFELPHALVDVICFQS